MKKLCLILLFSFVLFETVPPSPALAQNPTAQQDTSTRAFGEGPMTRTRVAALAVGALAGYGLGWGTLGGELGALSGLLEWQYWPFLTAAAGAVVGEWWYANGYWPFTMEHRFALRRGDTGPAVAILVEALINAGVYEGPSTQTYNGEVENAVREFQRRNALRVDGVAGPNTLSQLGLL